MKTGAQMILAMKLISLAFDLDSGAVRDFPHIFHYGGYLFHVGNVLLGPWISFHDYMSALNQPSDKFFVSQSTYLRRIIKMYFSRVSHFFFAYGRNCYSESLPWSRPFKIEFFLSLLKSF